MEGDIGFSECVAVLKKSQLPHLGVMYMFLSETFVVS